MIYKFSLLLVLYVYFMCVDAKTRLTDQKLIKEFFNKKYDRRLRPINGKSGPVVVSVNIYVRTISKLENDELHLQITLRQEWKDERLNFSGDPKKYLNLNGAQVRIWTPDLFFSNETESNNRNKFIRIWPNGDVLCSTRISLKVPCPMVFTNYPLDRQRCSIRMTSYGKTTKDIIYKWRKSNPVQTSNPILPIFTLEQFTTDYCDSETSFGIYSCLRLDLLLTREFLPSFIKIFLPCSILVLFSYLSFWVALEINFARNFLSGTTSFLLLWQILIISLNAPKVPYTKAVDLWTWTCLTFAVVAFLEGLILQFIYIRLVIERNPGVGLGFFGLEEVSLRSENLNVNDSNQKVSGNSDHDHHKCMSGNLYSIPSVPGKIDCAFRIGFPILFITFTIVYAIVFSRKAI